MKQDKTNATRQKIVPKPVLVLKKTYSPEIQEELDAVKLAQEADDPLWTELAQLLLEDLKLMQEFMLQQNRKRLEAEVRNDIGRGV